VKLGFLRASMKLVIFADNQVHVGCMFYYDKIKLGTLNN